MPVRVGYPVTANAQDWSDPWLLSVRLPGSCCWQHFFQVRGSCMSQVVECKHTPSLALRVPWGCWGNWASLGLPYGIPTSLSLSHKLPSDPCWALFLLTQKIREEMGREGTDHVPGPWHFISLVTAHFHSWSTFPYKISQCLLLTYLIIPLTSSCFHLLNICWWFIHHIPHSVINGPQKLTSSNHLLINLHNNPGRQVVLILSSAQGNQGEKRG